MNYTGFAGTFLGWAVMLTAYVIVGLGLFHVWSWILFEGLIKRVMIWLKMYKVFVEFMWDREKYRRSDKNLYDTKRKS